MADGYISLQGSWILNINKIDIDVLEKIKKCVETNKPIYGKKSDLNAAVLHITSKKCVKI